MGVTDDGALTFGLVKITGGFTRPDFPVEPGQTVEISDQQTAFGRDVAALIRTAGGAALLIDYGRHSSMAQRPIRWKRRARWI